jgi:predicted RNA binding protein YcfA (HicA-like mRNA interferase family)
LKKLSPIAGKKLSKILCNKFGFRVIRQKGSHATLTNGTIYVTVPQNEIRVGLLGVILRDCGITREEFLNEV